jgi:hypothetical protein
MRKDQSVISDELELVATANAEKSPHAVSS